MNKLKAQIKAFWDSPLDEEEQWYENHSDEFKPVDNQSEMRKKMIEAAKKNGSDSLFDAILNGFA